MLLVLSGMVRDNALRRLILRDLAARFAQRRHGANCIGLQILQLNDRSRPVHQGLVVHRVLPRKRVLRFRPIGQQRNDAAPNLHDRVPRLRSNVLGAMVTCCPRARLFCGGLCGLRVRVCQDFSGVARHGNEGSAIEVADGENPPSILYVDVTFDDGIVPE